MVNSIRIDQDSREFLDYLQDEICENIMERNKITIHAKTGNMYYDNIDTGESIYTFFAAQQDQTKKLMSEEFQFFDSYEEYIMNYITAIENETYYKLDMLTNKNSKFLFYHFNQYLAEIGQPLKFVGHSVISDNNYALTVLQERVW